MTEKKERHTFKKQEYINSSSMNSFYDHYIVLLCFFEGLKASNLHVLQYNTLFKMYPLCACKIVIWVWNDMMTEV